MGFDLKKIRKFDNSLKTIDERREYVEKLLGNNVEMIDEHNHGAMLESDRLSENMPLNITIEEFGTYLLKSGDAESCRSGEYTFYETERDYRSRYKIGKASIATDMSSNDEFIDYAGESVENNVEYDKYKLFNFSEMTIEQKKNLIRVGLKEKDNPNCAIKDDLQSAYEYIIDLLSDVKDKMIVEMLISGRAEPDIAASLCMTQQAVNKRLNRICEKKI